MLNHIDSFLKNGPMVTAWNARNRLRSRYSKVPGSMPVFWFIDKALYFTELCFDRPFDWRFRTDTGGFIPLKDLTIKGRNIEECHWYQPMSVTVFKRIMDHVDIDFSEFEFIDFGSGKGRVLLLAAGYGFKKIIGVEFAQELHNIAVKNLAAYESVTKKPAGIELVCEDAVKFPLPDSPLVLFFYSPFEGSVLEQVISNIRESHMLNPRKIVLIFHGRNAHSLALLESLNFQSREIEIVADWSRIEHQRTIVFTSPE